MKTSRTALRILGVLFVLILAGLDGCGPSGGSSADAGPDVLDAPGGDARHETALDDVPTDAKADLAEAAEPVPEATPEGVLEVVEPPEVAEPDEIAEVWETEPECVADGDCDDGNPCTGDRCATAGLCVHLYADGPCDDADPCTDHDACVEGTCVGDPVKGCGAPVCGDGACAGDETCAGCPVDCSPLGEGACGQACDPVTTPGTCTGNALCVPVDAAGLPFTAPLVHGNGACGVPCATDTDCPDGACLPVEGLGATGVCVLPCDPAAPGSCGEQATCFPRADDAGAGVCLAAAACAESPGCPCVGVAALAAGSVCLDGCWTNDPEACWNGWQACLPFGGSAWHAGLCVDVGAACDTVTQQGCAAAETCTPFTGPGLGGVAWRCTPALGGAANEALCLDDAACAAGLACVMGACRAYCDPGAPACAAGACVDVGAVYYLPAGRLGACVASCGDGTCDPAEGCTGCPEDCGACAPWCGDGACDPDEDCTTCAPDCGACPSCGDGTCDPATSLGAGEDCFDCEADCGPCAGTCGDGACSPLEACLDCPSDCGDCQVACGDGACAFGETCEGCSADCDACPWTCGDGACDQDETCLSCPSDCDLFGFACTAPCDPLDGDTACAGNAACVPTLDGRVFPAAFQVGNGACGDGCDGDADCPDGVCLALDGLDRPGVCATTCQPGGSPCAGTATCVPLPDDAAHGACVAGPECGQGVDDCPPEAAACVPWTAAPSRGVCLPGCWWQDDAACPTGGACHARAGDRWHQGICAGQADACEPVTQAGCDAARTCLPFGGAALSGHAFVCSSRVGDGDEGAPCDPWSQFCAPGLVCLQGSCALFCDPAAPDVCAPLACDDVGPLFGLRAGTLGVCR
jgi:hypothetical protein